MPQVFHLVMSCIVMHCHAFMLHHPNPICTVFPYHIIYIIIPYSSHPFVFKLDVLEELAGVVVSWVCWAHQLLLVTWTKTCCLEVSGKIYVNSLRMFEVTGSDWYTLIISDPVSKRCVDDFQALWLATAFLCASLEWLESIFLITVCLCPTPSFHIFS